MRDRSAQAPSAAYGCTNGVLASQRALAGRPSVEAHPLPLGDWIGLDPVGVTQGQGWVQCAPDAPKKDGWLLR
jgi:hypothetical protein